MSTIQAHVQYLAAKIGPRGTGTTGEAAAADYVDAQLSTLGLPVERRILRAVASQNAFPMAVDQAALLAMVLYTLGGPLMRWLAAFLALACAPMLWQAIIHSDSPLQFMLPKVTSRNVVTQVEPSKPVRRRVVILAHIDTNRCRLAWQSRMLRSLEPLTWLTLAMLGLLGLLLLVGALFGGPDWIWWLSLLPTAYIIGTLITLWQDDRKPFSKGAHDNAASVAVALEIGKRLVQTPLENTQVWLAFTGAEETDHAGVKSLLHEQGSLLQEAFFINLEGLGSGDLTYLSCQGLCKPYRPDPHLLDLSQQIAEKLPELMVKEAQMVMEDEARTLREGGWRAITIAGRDPDTATLPHWHRPDDTVDTVSEEFMQRAASFVLALIQEMDTEAGREE
jgi:hypothetical protein